MYIYYYHEADYQTFRVRKEQNMIGFELEVRVPKDKKDELWDIVELIDYLPGHFEEDVSVSIEYVSPITSARNFKSLLRIIENNFLEIIRKQDMKLYRYNAGLHLHVNKKRFVDDNHIKIVKDFIHNNYITFRKIGQRHLDSLLEYSSPFSGSRYSMVNTSNTKTVEFRFMSTSYTAEEIEAKISTLLSLVDMTKNKEIPTLQDFINNLPKNAKNFVLKNINRKLFLSHVDYRLEDKLNDKFSDKMNKTLDLTFLVSRTSTNPSVKCIPTIGGLRLTIESDFRTFKYIRNEENLEKLISFIINAEKHLEPYELAKELEQISIDDDLVLNIPALEKIYV